jgi:hypothetical protein
LGRNQCFSQFTSNEHLKTVLQARFSFNLRGVPLQIEDDGITKYYWDGGMSDAMSIPLEFRDGILITVCPFSSTVDSHHFPGACKRLDGTYETGAGESGICHIHISPAVRDCCNGASYLQQPTEPRHAAKALGYRDKERMEKVSGPQKMRSSLLCTCTRPLSLAVAGISCHLSLCNLVRGIDTTIPRGQAVMCGYMHAGYQDAQARLSRLKDMEPLPSTETAR